MQAQAWGLLRVNVLRQKVPDVFEDRREVVCLEGESERESVSQKAGLPEAKVRRLDFVLRIIKMIAAL